MAAAPAHSTVDRDRLAAADSRPSSTASRGPIRGPRALHEQAKASLLDGVPMNWMIEWASPFPLFVEAASGARFRCVDGHDYVDFCLGDTGAMAGHGPAPTIAAVERQMRRGITHMLPTEDAIAAGEELGPAVRAAALAVHDDRDRRQPLLDPARPPDHRPVEDPRPRRVLPRLGRRDPCDARRRTARVVATRR